MKIFRLFAVLVILALAGVALAQLVNHKQADKVYPARNYVQQEIETDYAPDGTPRTFSYSVFFVSAGGDIHQTWVRVKDGKPSFSTVAIANSEGQFEYVPGSAKAVMNSVNDDPDREKRRSPQYHLTSPQYKRQDKVLGFTTYVLEQEPDASGGYYEIHFAPEVGVKPVRIVRHRADGSRLVSEAVKIDFVDELPAERFVTPNLPIDCSRIESQAADAEAKGNHELALRLKRSVDLVKERNKR